MLKKRTALFLACILSLSLAACGGNAPDAPAAETTAPAQTQAPVPETTGAITEPTLSPEEQLTASLPEKVRQAYDLGLVDLELLTDLDRSCTTDEAAAIIQKIYGIHYGGESIVMDQVPVSTLSGREVTRHWLSLAMYAASAEWLYHAAPADSFSGNAEYLTNEAFEGNHIDDYFIANGMAAVSEAFEEAYFYEEFDPDAVWSHGYNVGHTIPEILGPPDWNEVMDQDWDEDMQARAEAEGWVKWLDYGFSYAHWTTLCADRLTGEKIMAGNMAVPFGPREKMTVREVVEAALRYSNWIPPEAEMLPYDEIPAYDASIITDDLLARETALPEASCQNLPKEWRGISLHTFAAYGESSGMADHLIQENEIQIIQDAGFNFVQILLDFRYYTSDQCNDYSWKEYPSEGCMNESRLKELDQVIAWCMERDIHVNLCPTEKIAGWPRQAIPPVIFAKANNAKPLAQQWQVLARRYAAIPNTYLSFTLFDAPEIWQPKLYGKFFTPVVEAIREVSPDRCVIADLEGRGDPGGDMAALGVALGTRACWPEDFHLERKMKAPARNALFESASWPYEKNGQIYDAEAAMTNKRWNCDAPDAVAAAAEEYGVGFMVFGWSPTRSSSPVLRERFSDGCMEAYLADFGKVLADRGYGWCYGDSNGFVGLFSAYPLVNSTTYTQVDNAPLYIDDEMFGWFQALNSAAK